MSDDSDVVRRRTLQCLLQTAVYLTAGVLIAALVAKC
jgi:hypothetical protein